MKNLLLSTIALGFAAAVSQAGATPVNFNFGVPTGDQGVSHTYTAGSPPLSITATAYGPALFGIFPDHLYGKNDGGDEVGLGMTNDPAFQNEISAGNGFIQLDVSNLFGNVTSLSTFFKTNSTTGGDAWEVFGSNTAGSHGGTALITGNTETTMLLPSFGTYTYYDFQALSGNFLIASITADQPTPTVPEPASMALLGTGLLGLGMVARRRKGA